MADLQFVDFALMRGRVRNEKQFGVPGDLSKIDVAILSRTSHPASGFPAVFHNPVRPLFGRIYKMFYTTRAKQELMRNFNISAFRGRNPASLTSRCNVTGKISGQIKSFFGLIKGRIMDKILLKFRLLSTLLVLQKVYLIRQN